MKNAADFLMRALFGFFLFTFAFLFDLGLRADAETANVGPLPDSCYHHRADCEVNLFRQLSRLYRPSREEDQVTAYLLRSAAEAREKVWKGASGFSWQKDSLGNVVIRVPATSGEDGRSSADSVALQAHTDMVTAVRGLKPGEDPKKYFMSGVELEESDGWLQSKGRKTTIGADDGFGVALAMRYLVDSSIKHPPLELVFTVQEEIGLFGASGLEIPLVSHRLINLDGNSGNSLILGTQGGSSEYADGKLQVAPVGRQLDVFRVAVTDLKGGHSGMAIYLPRANSIKAAARLLVRMHEEGVPARLMSLVGGNLKILNQIPNSFELLLSLDQASRNHPWTAALLRSEMDHIIRENSDEDPALFKIEVSSVPNTGRFNALSPSDTQDLARRLADVPHGMISKNGKYPNGIETSTSFSAIQFVADSAEPVARMGYLGRSFSDPGLTAISELTTSKLRAGWPGSFEHRQDLRYSPWEMRQDTTLAKIALNTSGYFKGHLYLAGGIETSSFLMKQPDIEMISFGGDIKAQHTPDERVRIQSFSEASSVLASILGRL